MLLRSFLILLLVFLTNIIDSKTVLMLVGVGNRSHKNVFWSVAKVLTDNGHSVIMISAMKPYPQVDGISEIIPEKLISDLIDSNNYQIDVCQKTLESTEIQKMLSNTSIHFDLVILNPFLFECGLGFVQYYKSPLVYLGTSGFYGYTTHVVGNPQLVAYKSNIFQQSKLQDVRLFENRISNVLSLFSMKFYREFYLFPALESLWRPYLKEIVSFSETEKYTSLVLLNTHITVEPPIPYMPNVIEIGGIHCNPARKLPEEIELFIESFDYVIMFSMGSMDTEENFSFLSESLVKVFSHFSRFAFIWKSNMVIQELPNNVKVMKWIPQNDILGHPKMSVLISHGGKLSLLESVYHSVPLIVIPSFLDQYMNAYVASQRGYAVTLESWQLQNASSVIQIINEVLENKEYKLNVIKNSEILRNQLISPSKRASYWLEYILRHKGAPSCLRSSAVLMPWYIYYSLDVLVFLICFTTIIMGITVHGIKTVLRKTGE